MTGSNSNIAGKQSSFLFRAAFFFSLVAVVYIVSVFCALSFPLEVHVQVMRKSDKGANGRLDSIVSMEESLERGDGQKAALASHDIRRQRSPTASDTSTTKKAKATDKQKIRQKGFPLSTERLVLDSTKLRFQPPPIQYLKRYIQLHIPYNSSSKAIEGLYGCPHRAGNFMTNWVTSLIIAMATNRSFTYHYTSWSDKGLHEADDIAGDSCNHILQRASWLFPQRLRPVYPWKQGPPFKEWCGQHEECEEYVRQHPESFDEFMPLDQNVSIRKNIFLWGVSACYLTKYSGFPGRFNLRDDDLCREYLQRAFGKEYVNSNSDSLIRELYAFGPDFAYGMLFSQSFRLSNELLATVQLTHELDEHAFSIGVHSRHPRKALMDLPDTARSCLDKQFSKFESDPGSFKNKCQLLIMSDRKETNDQLVEYAAQKGCQGVLVQRNEKEESDRVGQDTRTAALSFLETPSILEEHGKYAGAGFYQDLAMVIQARHGFCGMGWSSSSTFISYVRAFHQGMLQWKELYEQFGPGRAIREWKEPDDVILY